jgi:hypothetical protein
MPSDYFVRIHIVRAGFSPCISEGNCTDDILAESPEFITFKHNSVVTALPGNGIRSSVPTPTKITALTVTHTITRQATGFSLY